MAVEEWAIVAQEWQKKMSENKANGENGNGITEPPKPKFSLEELSNNGSNNGNGNNKVHPLAKRLSNSFNAGASIEANEESKISQSNQFTFSQAKAKLSGIIRAKANRKETTFRPRKDTLYDDPEMFRKKMDPQHNEEKEGFGWITGVLIRCILCIFGTTLFLRMSWIVGQAGLVLGIVVILLSFVVVLITAISMSAIATNGEVKNGGCYYLISRSLGPEFGGSIGLILFVANTVNASMNCVGLAEAIVQVLEENGIKLLDGAVWDIRLYALATCLFLQAIIFIGTEFENKTQLGLMVTIMIGIFSHFLGTLLPLNEIQREKGVVGYSITVLLDNLWPDFRGQNNLIQMFGIYFPAMTGIMAGANMSGDLRDPSSSIPRGTFWAIAITTLIYGWCMFVTGITTVRDATGISPPQFDNHTGHFIPPPCKMDDTCKFGLANDYQVMALQGAWSPLILVGIFATSLSSASGCLIGAPRIFQALCADKLFPFVHCFSKGNGKNNDPYRAYFLTLLIALSVIMIGELNLIADLISNFFLAAFAITNFACFDASAAKSPGFRPGFRFYNKWLSLFGSILCVCIMFMLNWKTSLITFFVFFLLFLFIKHNKSHINWGTSTDANRYRRALTSLLKISRTEDHVKNYRPQLLVLTGSPAARQALVDFAYCISNGRSLLLCGHIIPHQSSIQATALIRKLNNRFTDWLYDQRIKAFYSAVAHQSLRAGVQCLLQCVGLGKMQPNILDTLSFPTVVCHPKLVTPSLRYSPKKASINRNGTIMIGYNSQWLKQCIGGEQGRKYYSEYMGVVADAFEANMAVCIFRNENDGLDHSALLSQEDQLYVRLPDLLLSDKDSSLQDDLNRGVEARKVRPKAKVLHNGGLTHARTELSIQNLLQLDRLPSGDHRKCSSANGTTTLGKYDQHFHMGPASPRCKFRTQIRGGFVDVWWLHDDGGLTLLLSHLLREHNTYLPNAKLRVFTICSKLDPAEVHQTLVDLLKKFRIHFSVVHVFSEDYDQQKLYSETMEEYHELMELLNNGSEKTATISEEILEKTRERTFRYLRHRELLLEFSSASSVVLISMPTASSSVILSPIYGMWLELLSKDMPPMLFVRGNDNTVITYYS